MRQRWVLLAIAGAMLAAFIAYGFWAARQPEDAAASDIRIATGSQSGMYHRFGKMIAANSGFPVGLQETGGSIDNIELLRQQKIDFALVQNDLAQYSKLGIRGQEKFEDISFVLSLFPEYVQVILPARSRISVLSELRGRKICIGPVGSGGYFNSLDILSEAGMRETVDYSPINKTAFECMEDVRNGEDIAAIMLTSNRKAAEGVEDFRQLYFSESIARALADQHPFFRVVTSRDEAGVVSPELVVDAYLATHADQASDKVDKLTRTLIANWDRYREELPGLDAVSIPDVRETIPFHAAAEAVLVENKLKKPDYLIWMVLIPWFCLILLCIGVERWKVGYDRLGRNPFRDDWRQYPLDMLGFISRPMLAASFLILLIWLAVLLLRYIEDYSAIQRATISPFAQMDVFDNVVWLFAYISSGFTSDNVYPVSFLGRFVVSGLAVAGLIGPITFIIYLVNASHRKAIRNAQGYGPIDMKNHVLLCGWNEKARGIIYTLTGQNVERPRQVVLVAELAEEMPLEAFRFDPRRVRYCRGNASDVAVLERAAVRDADAILFLAQFGGNENFNKQGILAAMNARNLNSTAHLCAELEYLENIDYFKAAGCNTLIASNHVVTRLAMIAALSVDSVDYIMDVVTHHGQDDDELHSLPSSELIGTLGIADRTVGEFRRERLGAGVNIIGVVDASQKECLYDAQFTSGEAGQSLVDARALRRNLDPGAIVIYSARRPADIFARAAALPPEPLSTAQFGIDYPRDLSLVVCSDRATLETMEAELRQVVDGLEFVGIDISERRPRTISDLATLMPDRIDKVLILGCQERRANLDSIEDLNEIDSDLILLTSLFEELRRRSAGSGKSGPVWPIVCEIGSIANREIARKAKADYVLPALLLVERLLSKEAYDKNHVTDFISAAMNLTDGVHLHCHTVCEGDGFCGERFDRLLATRIDGAIILGWRPLAADLKNRQGDFGFHYRTVIDKRIRFETASPGDRIIMLVARRDRYLNTGGPAPAAGI